MGTMATNRQSIALLLLVVLVAVGAGCERGSLPAQSRAEPGFDGQLIRDCRNTVHEFQEKFERTASQSGMKPLKQWFDQRLAELDRSYGREPVRDTIVGLAKTDDDLEHPVPQIILGHMKTREKGQNEPSAADG